MNKGHIAFGDVINLEKLRADLDIKATHALIRSENMEVIRMALPKGKQIPDHHVKGEITVQCLKGQVQFSVGETTHVLSKNDWIALEKGVSHSLKVEEDVVLLLTVLFLKQTG